jgi:oligoribonuclease NrnB/cAMP/cGMP phosphodiesterase (DHH superfamily)
MGQQPLGNPTGDQRPSTGIKPLCIYHGACDDGFGAAWAVRKGLHGNVDFFPGVYQKEPPPHEGRNVIFVDFSYKRAVLNAMARKARSILILDHHKTAAEDLADLQAPFGTGYDRHLDNVYQDTCEGLDGKMYALFDMERSGAAMAWDYFVGGTRPDFIEYLQDRDLWRKALPNGDEFTIALRSYPQDFNVWDDLVRAGAESLIAEGESIQRYYRLRVEELKRSAYPAMLGGGHCWISNAPYFAASEVAGELCDRPGAMFGACYFEVERGRFKYSLRSRGHLDVSDIARRFGGGGHQNAAGFSTNRTVHTAITDRSDAKQMATAP